MADIVEQVSADAVSRLRRSSGEVANELREAYNDFFQILHERVINDPDMFSAMDGTPSIFKGSGLSTNSWKAVTPKWFDQKEKAQKAGSFRALNFYHGVTESMIGAGFSRRSRKGRFKKRRSRLSFDMFIQSLAMNSAQNVSDVFGPLKIAYSIERPDKGKVQLTMVDDAVKVIRQWKPKGSGFAKAIDGTIIKTSITAFPKVAGLTSERSVINYMIKKTGHKEQWVKVLGNGETEIRAILLPLINWYLKSQFILLMEERFG